MKRFYQNESDIPAAYKDQYEARDGGWWLKPIEGLVPKENVDEFRNKNIELTRELRETKEKLKPFEEAGVDVVKFKELAAKEADLRDEKLLKKGELETVITERTKGIQEEHARVVKAKDEALAARERDLKAAQDRESKLVINEGVLAAMRKRGIKPGADDLALSLSAQQMRLVDGKTQIIGADGKVRSSNKTGLDLTIDEWADELAASKPMLFEENKGSGSEPGNPGGGGSGGSGQQGNPGYNPWDDKTWNMTEQMKLTGKNPAEAKRLCEKAGKKWIAPKPPTGRFADPR